MASTRSKDYKATLTKASDRPVTTMLSERHVQLMCFFFTLYLESRTYYCTLTRLFVLKCSNNCVFSATLPARKHAHRHVRRSELPAPRRRSESESITKREEEKEKKKKKKKRSPIHSQAKQIKELIPARRPQLEVPRDPVVFIKPADALIGPTDDIHVHTDARSQLDWEGEMAIIIGRDCKNATLDNALDFVLGYAIGNDVSARNFQVPANVSGGQYCYAKSFDGFAPVGAAIAAPSVVSDPQKLNFTTRVNGEVKQRTCTSDMIWSVGEIVVHLSRGTTLRKGTVVMTGTPSGIGFFAGEFLRDGDVVEVEMDHAGSIRNRIVFD
jgi:2-keto-4-pentenoate hydratase/2-oxohepta-3-ene-1,7-dioic acid hydratase in catechol pathway